MKFKFLFLSLLFFNFVWAGKYKEFNYDYSKTQSVKAVIKTQYGNIELDLTFKESPNTVANFITLSRKKFYDGLTFHRVIPNFMIQGGDPKGNGTGGPGYLFKDEKNVLTHETGTIAMANRGPNTNGSQFFINHKPNPHLNGRHTVFGKVTKGLDIIYKVKRGDKIISVTIDEKKSGKK